MLNWPTLSTYKFAVSGRKIYTPSPKIPNPIIIIFIVYLKLIYTNSNHLGVVSKATWIFDN